MKNISAIKKCANCGACYNECPKNAITVEKDSLYYRVKVIEEKCIGCGRCVTVCPVNSIQKRNNIQKAYCCYSGSNDVIMASSSGGIFHCLAEYVLENKGVVWGATYSDDYRSVFFSSSENSTLLQLQKSKYVESLVGTSFSEIKKTLESDRLVLFCGTPCQVAGLKRFLKHDFENLITCDFTCGGVPGHGIYNQYLDWVEGKKNSNISEVDFRPKTFGWDMHAIMIKLKNGKQYHKLAMFDPYFYQFVYQKNSVRDYCYECQFSDNHYADIILADYWKYFEAPKDKVNMNGTSLVVTNSLKGEKVLKQISSKMMIYMLDEKGLYNIRATIKDKSKFAEHLDYIETVKKSGVCKAHKKYDKQSIARKLKYFLKYSLRKA